MIIAVVLVVILLLATFAIVVWFAALGRVAQTVSALSPEEDS